jgi:putative ABC transport system permease protein
MNNQPPKWIDRFLRWYCNPDLLEEIQGDVHELYFERVRNEGERAADLKYAWDVLRFFRWSNIKRDEYVPGSMGALWNLNFKIAARNARKNKLIFAVKTIGLSICLAFALLLTAFVVNELTFDQFHVNHDRIYRISTKVNFQDHVTHYAVTPLPTGQALVEGIPEIENYFRFMYQDKPIYHIDDAIFYDEVTLAADSNFLKILSFDFVQGTSSALNEPDKIVLTEKMATKFFGDEDAVGKSIEFGRGILLEVAAVIKDVPSNSHLKFDALISWDTFDRNDDWGNLNAYTYILLKPNATIEMVQNIIPNVLDTFDELVVREYKATFEMIFEKITDIHFSQNLDEDIAEKRNKSNLFILIAVVVLFLITGLINYLNLTLAELTTNVKKIGILRVYGGMANGHGKILISETLFTMLIVLPLSILLSYFGLILAAHFLSIRIDQRILFSPGFILAGISFLFLLFASTRVNSLVLSKTSRVINSLKGRLSSTRSDLSARKFLVAAQLSFSIIMIALIILIVDQFHFIQDADKGFDEKNMVVVKLRSNEALRVEAFSETLKKVSGIAQVEGGSYYPGAIETKYVFQVETDKGMEQRLVPMMNCSYGYLNALNIKVVKGRRFNDESVVDRHGSFIINETAAKEFGWKDAIGKKISGPENYVDGEVIGVVKDFNFASLHSKIEPMIIFPTDENWGNLFVYIKVNPLRPLDLISTIEKEFKAQWPELPFEWEYLDSKYLSLYKNDYELKNIFEVGLVISILISCLGIFSISALLVTLRSKEMGIRKIVGANSLQLFLLHTKSFLQFLVISILVAWPVIWYLSNQWLENFAYRIELNVWYFIIPGLIALFITIITSSYHGIKNAMVNPVDILKHE